jgi:hypothetical protein
LKEGIGTKKTFFEFKFLFLLGEKERSSLQSFLPEREKEKKKRELPLDQILHLQNTIKRILVTA